MNQQQATRSHFEELDAEDRPGGWILAASNGLSWAIDSQTRHHGQRSVRITGEDVTAKFVGLRTAYPIPLNASRVYEISGWAKASDLTFIVESLVKYTDSDPLLRAHRDAVARAIESLTRPQM